MSDMKFFMCIGLSSFYQDGVVFWSSFSKNSFLIIKVGCNFSHIQRNIAVGANIFYRQYSTVFVVFWQSVLMSSCCNPFAQFDRFVSDCFCKGKACECYMSWLVSRDESEKFMFEHEWSPLAREIFLQWWNNVLDNDACHDNRKENKNSCLLCVYVLSFEQNARVIIVLTLFY